MSWKPKQRSVEVVSGAQGYSRRRGLVDSNTFRSCLASNILRATTAVVTICCSYWCYLPNSSNSLLLSWTKVQSAKPLRMFFPSGTEIETSRLPQQVGSLGVYGKESSPAKLWCTNAVRNRPLSL